MDIIILTSNIYDFKYSDSNTGRTLNIQIGIWMDLNPFKRVWIQIRMDSIHTIYTHLFLKDSLVCKILKKFSKLYCEHWYDSSFIKSYSLFNLDNKYELARSSCNDSVSKSNAISLLHLHYPFLRSLIYYNLFSRCKIQYEAFSFNIFPMPTFWLVALLKGPKNKIIWMLASSFWLSRKNDWSKRCTFGLS